MYPRSHTGAPNWGHPSRADSERVETVDATHQRQEVYRGLNQRFNDLEAGFKNLKETVPPHAQDWWQEQEPHLEAKLEVVRGELNTICHDLAGLLDRQTAVINDQLANLKIELTRAQEGLGARTAAGRAKENT